MFCIDLHRTLGTSIYSCTVCFITITVTTAAVVIFEIAFFIVTCMPFLVCIKLTINQSRIELTLPSSLIMYWLIVIQHSIPPHLNHHNFLGDRSLKSRHLLNKYYCWWLLICHYSVAAVQNIHSKFSCSLLTLDFFSCHTCFSFHLKLKSFVKTNTCDLSVCCCPLDPLYDP